MGRYFKDGLFACLPASLHAPAYNVLCIHRQGKELDPQQRNPIQFDSIQSNPLRYETRRSLGSPSFPKWHYRSRTHFLISMGPQPANTHDLLVRSVSLRVLKCCMYARIMVMVMVEQISVRQDRHTNRRCERLYVLYYNLRARRLPSASRSGDSTRRD